MATRVELQEKLENILGSRNVYFQPPEGIKMNYPAIVYSLGGINLNFADNIPYKKGRYYTITLIHKNPDNDVIDKILEMPYTRLERPYVADNLYHYVFETYF